MVTHHGGPSGTPKAHFPLVEFPAKGFTGRCIVYAAIALVSVYGLFYYCDYALNAMDYALIICFCLYEPYCEWEQYKYHNDLVSELNETLNAHTYSTEGYLRISRDKDHEIIQALTLQYESVVAERNEIAARFHRLSQRERDEKGRFISKNRKSGSPSQSAEVILLPGSRSDHDGIIDVIPD